MAKKAKKLPSGNSERKEDLADIEAQAKEPSEIGRIVRVARKQSGLRQAQAAALCGVGTRFLSDLENGKPTLHLGKVLKVLHGFGLLVTIKRRGFVNG